MAVIKLNTTDGGQCNFSLKNDADKTLVKSEQYNTKSAAENGIESVKNNADNAARYDAKASDSGKFYFNLKAGNGQIIGTSPMFAFLLTFFSCRSRRFFRISRSFTLFATFTLTLNITE